MSQDYMLGIITGICFMIVLGAFIFWLAKAPPNNRPNWPGGQLKPTGILTANEMRNLRDIGRFRPERLDPKINMKLSEFLTHLLVLGDIELVQENGLTFFRFNYLTAYGREFFNIKE